MTGRLSIRAKIAAVVGAALLALTAVDAAVTLALVASLERKAAVMAQKEAPLDADLKSAPTRSISRELLDVLLPYLLLDALGVALVAAFVLNRMVARPIDRLTDAFDRVSRFELDNPLQGGAPTLGRLGAAFERMAFNLKDERARVARQIEELKALNRELTEARESLVRSEKLATVGRLAAGVAHEIGNPLGAIVGYLELARGRAGKGGDVTELLDHVSREVERIDRTVRELLDYSRPAPPALGPVPLRESVEAAVRLASVQQRLKGIAFEIDVPESLRVVAEGHHLSQILVNLLLNAGDAMKGEGSITFVARGRESGGDGEPTGAPARVELDIRDTGPGIPAGDLARIFDPFFTTKDPGEGTGLGLSICHRLMESFGGELHAANAEEGGAVFTLVFRAADVVPTAERTVPDA